MREVIIPEKKVQISKCYHECPFFMAGGHGDPMQCDHPITWERFPKHEDRFIIEHPQCDDGFPDECPLLLHKYQIEIHFASLSTVVEVYDKSYVGAANTFERSVNIDEHLIKALTIKMVE